MLFVLCVELLDLAVAHLHQAVGYAVVRLHNVLGAHTFLTGVKSVLCVQRVCLQQVLQQRGVFLLHVTHANGFLPVHPIGLGLLQVRVLLCVLAAFVDSGNQVLHNLAAVLTVLAVESTTTTKNLMHVLADTQLFQLVCRYVHTDFFCLCTHRVVHDEHVPYLIADLSVHVFVKIRTTGLDLIDLCQLFFSCLVLRVVDFLTFNHAHVLAATVEKTATGVQKVSEDKCQHGETDNRDQQCAMISNSL